MKRIVSKQEASKKAKRNQLFLGVILVSIMVFSAFGIVANSAIKEDKVETLKYNGYDFIAQGNYFALILGQNNFYFLSNPQDIPEIPLNLSNTLIDYTLGPVYIDSLDTVYSSEIYQNINPYVERIQMACLNEEDCQDETFPIKTCEENLISIRESNQNRIYQQENCVFIEGKSEDLLKVVDYFLLEIIGING